MLYNDDNLKRKEITFQEFAGQLLESGQVDTIMVSNKKTARYVFVIVLYYTLYLYWCVYAYMCFVFVSVYMDLVL